jgi:hypothetical protein
MGLNEINIIGLMKLKRFCPTKEMVSTLKRPPTEWEKIFTNYQTKD